MVPDEQTRPEMRNSHAGQYLASLAAALSSAATQRLPSVHHSAGHVPSGPPPRRDGEGGQRGRPYRGRGHYAPLLVLIALF
jgi:hypothetical protein